MPTECWHQNTRKQQTSSVLCTLPPSIDRFILNVKRTLCHSTSMICNQPIMDGERISSTNYLFQLDFPMVLIKLYRIIILKNKRCGCKSDQPCGNGYCSCMSSQMPCTAFCGCSGGPSCQNPFKTRGFANDEEK